MCISLYNCLNLSKITLLTIAFNSKYMLGETFQAIFFFIVLLFSAIDFMSCYTYKYLAYPEDNDLRASKKSSTTSLSGNSTLNIILLLSM